MAIFVIDPKNPHLGGNCIGGPTGDPATFEPELWKWFVDNLGIHSVLDIGCGCGYSTDAFTKMGLQATGIDGLPANINFAQMHHQGSYILHDFRNPLGDSLLGEYDLAWCCEFLEHIEAQYNDNVFDAIKRCKWVAATYAIKGQGGYHHVQEASEEYWIDQFKSRGFAYHGYMTTLSCNIASGCHYRNKGMVYWRL
jgi:SAM-dependent methyltransferase